jgi:phosphohistidine phosphatase
MLLHLLRHAHAGDAETWDGPDATRPLSDKGRAQSERLGAFLAEIGFVTDALITSPKVRALQTAELVADRLGVEVADDARLGGMLDLDVVEAILRDAGDPVRPLLVGHDPDFSDLLETLCGAPIPMRKGAFARIEVDRPLEARGGTLRWLLPPDAITLAR